MKGIWDSEIIKKHILSHNIYVVFLKGALSGLRQFLANESLLKLMKNTFYFTLKALPSQDI